MVFKLNAIAAMLGNMFENDVKMYGIQTYCRCVRQYGKFENDVKMYGIQTHLTSNYMPCMFENDVKMYGIQTNRLYCKRVH